MTKTVEVTQTPDRYVTITQKKNVSTVTHPVEQVIEISSNAGGVSAAAIIPLVSYRHNQSAVSALWTINHNLKFLPNVTVFNSADGTVEGNVVHTSLTSLYIEFSAPFSGYAVLS
jgi:hypothetical protein